MTCGKCDTDKHPCLFSPSQVKKSGVRYCRVCMVIGKDASMRGWGKKKMGVTKSQRLQIVAHLWNQNDLNYAKRQEYAKNNISHFAD